MPEDSDALARKSSPRILFKNVGLFRLCLYGQKEGNDVTMVSMSLWAMLKLEMCDAHEFRDFGGALHFFGLALNVFSMALSSQRGRRELAA